MELTVMLKFKKRSPPLSQIVQSEVNTGSVGSSHTPSIDTATLELKRREERRRRRREEKKKKKKKKEEGVKLSV